MPIITISRGSYSKGKEIAEKLGQTMGYEVVSREIALNASEEFNVPEIQLVRAIHDAPSILDRLTHKKERYVAFIRAALLEHFCRDNVIYHGLAGHFFIRNIAHVLKVRIIADMGDRVQAEMEREGISEEEALRVLKEDDDERRKWSKYLYGIDTRDSNLYDLVIHVHKISVDDAVEVICRMAQLKQFQATPESTNALKDLALSAAVKAALPKTDYTAKVTVKDGFVNIKTGPIPHHQLHRVDDIDRIIKNIPGIRDLRVDAEPALPISE